LIPLLSLGNSRHAHDGAPLFHARHSWVQPGPLFIKDHPDIFWGLIASMYLGNALLIILNLLCGHVGSGIENSLSDSLSADSSLLFDRVV